MPGICSCITARITVPISCRYRCSSITKAIIDLQLEITASAQRCGITYSERCLADGVVAPRLIIQMEMSSLLTLDAIDRAIGDFLVGLPVQRPPDRKPARCVISNNLNAADRLAPRPLPNGLQALFSNSPVPHSDCFPLRHAANI